MAEYRDVLVTGGAGFIGKHLATALTESSDVTVLDSGFPPQNSLPDDLRKVEADIRDADTVSAAVANADVVFHHAGLVSVDASINDPKQSHTINSTGTLNVLEAARHHDARVIIASSAAIYGHPEETPISESHPLQPTSPYGLDKLTADHYARLYNDLYGLETVALRYFNVYGPDRSGGEYAGVIEIFLDQARSGGPITVNGDGKQTRDFVHVDDVVQANLLAAETDAVGEAFNVGTGESISILELATLIRASVDDSVEIVHSDRREGDIRHSCADITRVREQLGYEPTITIEDELGTLLQ